MSSEEKVFGVVSTKRRDWGLLLLGLCSFEEPDMLSDSFRARSSSRSSCFCNELRFGRAASAKDIATAFSMSTDEVDTSLECSELPTWTGIFSPSALLIEFGCALTGRDTGILGGSLGTTCALTCGGADLSGPGEFGSLEG